MARTLIARLLWADFRGIGPLAMAQAVATACGLVTTVFWTRLMPQTTFGEYKIIVATISLASTFCLVGIAQAAVMSASSNKDGNFLRLTWTKAAANIVGAGVVGGVAGYYAYTGTASPELILGLIAAAILFPVYNLSDLWVAWLNGKALFKRLSLGKILLAACPLLTLSLLLALDRNDLVAVVVLSMTMICAINFWFLYSASRNLANADRAADIERFGHHASAASLVQSVTVIDALVLNHYYSPAEVAVYAIALQLPELAKTAQGLFGQILSPPIYAATSTGQAWRAIMRPFWLLTTAYMITGLIGFLLLEYAIVLLFSNAYSGAAHYAKWLWLAVCLAGSPSLLGMILLATKKPIFLYVPYIGYPVLLGLLFFLLGSKGIDGLTLARIIATIGLAAFYVIAFVGELSLTPSKTE